MKHSGGRFRRADFSLVAERTASIAVFTADLNG